MSICSFENFQPMHAREIARHFRKQQKPPWSEETKEQIVEWVDKCEAEELTVVQLREGLSEAMRCAWMLSPFVGPVPMPAATAGTPDEPDSHPVDHRFVGRQRGCVQVDDGVVVASRRGGVRRLGADAKSCSSAMPVGASLRLRR